MALGASTTLAFAPFDFWFLLYPAFFVFIVLLLNHSKNPFIDSWLFGFGYFGVGISWVHVSIATFGGLPLVISVLMMVLLCGYLALYFALAFWILKKLVNVKYWPLAAPFIWLITEFTRANFLTGFPWLSIGYSQINSPFAPLFPVIGEIGVSIFLFGLLVSISCFFARERNVKFAIPYIVIFAVVTLFSSFTSWHKPTGKVKEVALVQGNIEQSIRWRPEQDQPTINKYLELTEPFWDADLIVWPEAAIPTLESLPLGFETLEYLDEKATEQNTAVITGAVDYNYRTKESYNFMLALGIDSHGENTVPYTYLHQNRYAKHQLLPIGEFVPFETLLRPLAPIFDLPMSSFSRGDYKQDNLIANGVHLTSAICYEIVFPRLIRTNITDESDMILTVSNDAWFGDSHGPHQHLQIAQIRALEFGLPVIRGTNNGVTAAVDANGVIIEVLDQFVDDVLLVKVALVSGNTVYRDWGDIPSTVIALLLALFAFFLQRKVK